MNRLLLLGVLCPLLAGCNTPAPAATPGADENAGRPLKVFLLAGQSNMVGQGDADELPEPLRRGPDNVRIVQPDGQLTELRPTRSFGPEVSFAHEIAAAWPDEHIVLLKHARGGTSTLDWSPQWTPQQAALTQSPHHGPMFRQLMDRVQTLRDTHDVQVVALLWAQGARDARFPAAADAYGPNLLKIFTAVRDELGQPDLPIILARTPDLPRGRFKDVDRVRQAQERLAATAPHLHLILTDDLPRHDDNAHFNTQGQLEQGRRFAHALLQALDAPPAPNP